MNVLVPATGSALATSDILQDPCFALCPPQQQRRMFGISQKGELYEYGDSPDKPKLVLPAEVGLVFMGLKAVAIIQRAGRDYLELQLESPVPLQLLSLNLPCHQSPTQMTVRTVLAAFLQAAKSVDVTATAGKLISKRGTKPGPTGFVANFMDLFIDVGLDGDVQFMPVNATRLDGDRDSLEIAVNHLCRALGHEPQFP
jgi:hypothetical protein